MDFAMPGQRVHKTFLLCLLPFGQAHVEWVQEGREKARGRIDFCFLPVDFSLFAFYFDSQL